MKTSLIYNLYFAFFSVYSYIFFRTLFQSSSPTCMCYETGVIFENNRLFLHFLYDSLKYKYYFLVLLSCLTFFDVWKEPYSVRNVSRIFYIHLLYSVFVVGGKF